MKLLTNQDLDALAAELPHVKAWLAAVEVQIKSAIETGAEFTNVRLVPTRPTRKWIEGLDILKILRKFSKIDVVAPRVPLSPAKMEKVVGKLVFKDKLAAHCPPVSSGVKLEYVGSSESEDED